MADELKPCPFCGGKPAFVPRAVNLALQKDPSDPKFGVSVICGQCSSESPNMVDEAHAAAKWNRRAAVSEAAAAKPTSNYDDSHPGDCPELNMSNYDHDDVATLNAWAVQAAFCIDRLERELLAASLPPSPQEYRCNVLFRDGSRLNGLTEDELKKHESHIAQVWRVPVWPPSPQPSPDGVKENGDA